MRAYSATVNEAVRAVPTCEQLSWQAFSLQAPYALEDMIRRTLEQAGAEVLDAEYGTDMVLQGRCHADRLSELQQQLADAGRGQIEWLTADQ
ncbi:MAG: DUF1949 domain-containing protein [Thiolinea sp.]